MASHKKKTVKSSKLSVYFSETCGGNLCASTASCVTGNCKCGVGFKGDGVTCTCKLLLDV